MARAREDGSVRSPSTISTGMPARLSRRLLARARQRTESPRPKRARTTWEPTKPVPPVTRFISACHPERSEGPLSSHSLAQKGVPRASGPRNDTGEDPAYRCLRSRDPSAVGLGMAALARAMRALRGQVPRDHPDHVSRMLRQLHDDRRLEPGVHEAVLAERVLPRLPVRPVRPV